MELFLHRLPFAFVY